MAREAVEIADRPENLRFEDVTEEDEKGDSDEEFRRKVDQIKFKRELRDQVGKAYSAKVSEFYDSCLTNRPLMLICTSIQVSKKSLFRQYCETQIAFASFMPKWLYELMPEEQRLELGKKYGDMIGTGVEGTYCDGHDCYNYFMSNEHYLRYVIQIIEVIWTVIGMNGQGINGRDLSWLIIEYMWPYPGTVKKMREKEKMVVGNDGFLKTIVPLIYSVGDLTECLELMQGKEFVDELRKKGVFRDRGFLVGMCMRALYCNGLPKSDPRNPEKKWERP